MGYERHNTTVRPKEARVSVAPEPAGTLHPRNIAAPPIERTQAYSGERNILREAREMRNEWRRNRHSRLFGR
jgi:hypothetical protein